MNAILAINEVNALGVNNKLPWDVPEDLEFFKLITSGNVVVMGRKTYQSLPSKGLPSRINIVLTKNPENYKNIDERLYFVNIETLYELIERVKGNKNVFVIGGAEIYNYFFKDLQKVYLTVIYNRLRGDTYSPITLRKLQEENFKLINKGDIHKSAVNEQLYQHLVFHKK